MQLSYLCPHCQSHLMIGNELILTIKSERIHKKGLLIMDPALGNYTIRNHPSIKFENGEVVDFYCPVCSANLVAEKIDKNLVQLILLQNGKEYHIYFSRIAGQHATFKIDRENIIEKFGEDSSGYISYFSHRMKKTISK